MGRLRKLRKCGMSSMPHMPRRLMFIGCPSCQRVSPEGNFTLGKATKLDSSEITGACTALELMRGVHERLKNHTCLSPLGGIQRQSFGLHESLQLCIRGRACIRPNFG